MEKRHSIDINVDLDEGVISARQRWIDFLRTPGLQKTKGVLEEYDEDNEDDPDYDHATIDNQPRCCLGHACYALNFESYVDVAVEAHTSYAVFYYGGADAERSDNGSDIELPQEVASLLDMDVTGSLKDGAWLITEGDTQHYEWSLEEQRPLEVEGRTITLVTSLTDLNDQTDIAPCQIADFIVDMTNRNNFNPYKEI